MVLLMAAHPLHTMKNEQVNEMIVGAKKGLTGHADADS